MCCKPRKGDKIIVFRTTRRDDNLILPLWMDDVKMMADDVANQGNACEEVTEPEAMSLATRWVMPSEKELLEKEVQRGVERVACPSYNDMTKKMTFIQFVEYVKKISLDKLPTNFKQDKSKTALQETLFDYGEVQRRIAKATREKDSTITFLRQKLETVNKRLVHLNARQTAINSERRTQNRTALVEVKPVNTEKHPYGIKSKPFYCQICWDLGLKKRRHAEAKCDPVQRKTSLERKSATAEEAKKKANKDKNPKKKPQAQASKERTHPFSDYKEWMCMHCKREDVAPKACKHPKEFCFRRPGGPLDAEGIKEPKARDKRSRELAAERRAQTLKTKASTKKVVRLATTTQSVGIPKRQVVFIVTVRIVAVIIVVANVLVTVGIEPGSDP